MTITHPKPAVGSKNLLETLTEGRILPEGTDTWTVRTVRPDFRSQQGFRWPFPGQWAEAPGPIITTNTDACPREVGDGICVATTWRGMASGGVPARTLLLCAISSEDVLSPVGGEKVRVRRAFVVDLIDGENLIRQHGSGANLSGADLRYADLSGANLSGADLRYADLYGADLRDADLSGANLSGANLSGADLSASQRARAKEQGARIS